MSFAMPRLMDIGIINELPHDKTNKVACAPSLIRVFAVHSMGS